MTTPMGSTHSAIHLHIVFGTKHRTPWISDEIRERLFEYLGGAIRANGGIALKIGGVADHVHLLIGWRPDETVSNLLRGIKAQSTKWIHATFSVLAEFRWQDGYSVFSVSPSQVERVKDYIGNQAEHHRKRNFQEELVALLEAHGVNYDERYI